MKSNPTVIFTGPKCVTMKNRPVPKPGKGQMLLRASRTLISTGTELTILNGEFPPKSVWANYGKFPFQLGYSASGVVVDTGKGVDKSLL